MADGNGGPPRTADVGITGGIITEVGPGLGRGRREISADGALVTPGFVDIHTHYDGQASWDERLIPSSWHGVTTVVMGNCGVGFAPVTPGHRQRLIDLMEGIEDIPGTRAARRPRPGTGQRSGTTWARSPPGRMTWTSPRRCRMRRCGCT